MNDEKLFDKLEELHLGQQRMELKLEAHLEAHKLSLKRLTSVYIPMFGVVIPSLISFLGWFHGGRHQNP